MFWIHWKRMRHLDSHPKPLIVGSSTFTFYLLCVGRLSRRRESTSSKKKRSIKHNFNQCLIPREDMPLLPNLLRGLNKCTLLFMFWTWWYIYHGDFWKKTFVVFHYWSYKLLIDFAFCDLWYLRHAFCWAYGKLVFGCSLFTKIECFK